MLNYTGVLFWKTTFLSFILFFGVDAHHYHVLGMEEQKFIDENKFVAPKSSQLDKAAIAKLLEKANTIITDLRIHTLASLHMYTLDESDVRYLINLTKSYNDEQTISCVITLLQYPRKQFEISIKFIVENCSSDCETIRRNAWFAILNYGQNFPKEKYDELLKSAKLYKDDIIVKFALKIVSDKLYENIYKEE